MQLTPDDTASDEREFDATIDEESLETDAHPYDTSQTGFDPDESDHGILMSDGTRRSYEHLNRVNSGYGERDRKQQLMQSDRIQDIRFVGNELGYTQEQLEFAERLITQLDLRKLSVSVEECVFACIAFSNDDHNDLYDSDTPVSKRFHEMMEAWDCSVERVQRAHERIREHWMSRGDDDTDECEEQEQARIDQLVDDIWTKAENDEIMNIVSHVQENVDESDHNSVYDLIKQRMEENV